MIRPNWPMIGAYLLTAVWLCLVAAVAMMAPLWVSLLLAAIAVFVLADALHRRGARR